METFNFKKLEIDKENAEVSYNDEVPSRLQNEMIM